MKVHLIILLFLVASGKDAVIADTFEDELAALDKDIGKDETAAINLKKPIRDLTTEELIAELERDIKGVSKDEDIEKKYRKRFEDILAMKVLSDEINFHKQDEAKKAADPYSDIVDALYNDYSLPEDAPKADTKTKKDTIEAPVPGKCVDVRTDCESLKSFCSTHDERLKVVCQKTCGYCVECKQKVPAKTCALLKSKKLCYSPNPATRNRMITLCPVTCGFCKVPTPPKCSGTKLGCCWDKTTAKSDAKGKNCPRCLNQYRHVCKTFKPDCTSFLKPGEFMRAFCPQACGLCQGTCTDDRRYVHLCPFWKKDLKWCTKQENKMKFFCAKTCDIC